MYVLIHIWVLNMHVCDHVYLYMLLYGTYMCMSVCVCVLIHGDVCVLVFNAYVRIYMHMCDLLVRKPHFP